MLKVIDKADEFVIQKITRPSDGSLIRYQTAKVTDLGRTDLIVVHSTLEDARNRVMMVVTAKKLFKGE